MAFKIPKHLSKEFKQLAPVKREEYIRSYRIWYNSDWTQKFLEDLEKQVQISHLEEDKKHDFLTWFQSKYWSARKKQERETLRSLIYQLKPEE